MIDLQVAATALILAVVGWIGVNVFDETKWENAATMCTVITVVCGLLFVIFIIAWVWGL